MLVAAKLLSQARQSSSLAARFYSADLSQSKLAVLGRAVLPVALQGTANSDQIGHR